jgi:hypothetical protein
VRIRGGTTSGGAGSGGDWAGTPHAVGEDDDDGEDDDEGKGGLVVREDEGEGVHGGVEDDHGEEVGTGAVVQPGEDDGDRDQEDHADQKVIHQSKTEWPVEIERGVPEGPGQPDEETGEERRETLLEARKKESAPAGFFEGGCKKESVQKSDAAIGRREPNRVAMLRRRQWRMKEMGDGRWDKQDRGPEEKCDSFHAGIAARSPTSK